MEFPKKMDVYYFGKFYVVLSHFPIETWITGYFGNAEG